MDIKRILDNININEYGCWVWNKSYNSAGYGQLTENGVYWLAHRYSFAYHNMGIDDFSIIRHVCFNTLCCNPEHLEEGSHYDNYHDSIQLHRLATDKLRGTWIINGIQYPTVTVASNLTGISQGAIIRNTVDGVFDLDRYRNNCLQANRKPKI